MSKIYFISSIASFLLSIALTILVRKLAWRFNIVDKPGDRKIHKQSIPLLGGMAIFSAFFLTLFFCQNQILSGELEPAHWIGFFIGAIFLMIGGLLDDKYDLTPSRQIIFPTLAIIAVIIGGVGIEKVTNPLGGLFYLDQLSFSIFGLGQFMLLADGFTVIWLLSMMYSTKLLDGLDGLVTGVCGIGGVIIFLFTMTTKYYQPDIALASLVFASVCFGFLIFNWHPAQIFLGEGGSLLLGYILGVLAIISGGKIAIALLVMGIPILDLFWTILRRLMKRKNPFRFADRAHLHHRFLDLGISQRQTVLIFYFLAIAFGGSGLFFQSRGKFMALIILFIIMIALVLGFNFYKKKH